MAEAFAREGIVTLIYDKQTRGYSLSGQSYELLADDAFVATHSDGVVLTRVDRGSPVSASTTAGFERSKRAILSGYLWPTADRTARIVRLMISAEMFPEATYDPVSVLERVDQPALAIWGEKERVVPTVKGLGSWRGRWGVGTIYSTVYFFPNTNHRLNLTEPLCRPRGLAPRYLI